MTQDQIATMAQIHYEHRLSALGMTPIWNNLPAIHRQQEIEAMRFALGFAEKPAAA